MVKMDAFASIFIIFVLFILFALKNVRDFIWDFQKQKERPYSSQLMSTVLFYPICSLRFLMWLSILLALSVFRLAVTWSYTFNVKLDVA